MKDRQRPIYGYGDECEEQPEFRQRLDLSYMPPKRIDRKPDGESQINAETSCTNPERLSRDPKRPLWNLMTKVAEELIKRCRQNIDAVDLSQWSGDYQEHPQNDDA